MVDTGLKGKTALITGVNNPLGIGAAVAEALAGQGVSVFVTYLRLPAPETEASLPSEAFYHAQNAKTADEVVRKIRAAGGRVEAWEADLADPASVPDLFDRAEKALGPVDILVNNAAHYEPDTFIPPASLSPERRAPDGFPIAPMTPGTIDRHFAVNARAVALCMAEYARRHVKRGAPWGRIINISTDGASGFPGSVSYGASKHALESYSRAAAAELGEHGITVNVLSLGPVQTGWVTKELETRIVQQIPLRRIGQPKEVADVVVFFASEQAGWITGQLLYVGGGHSIPL